MPKIQWQYAAVVLALFVGSCTNNNNQPNSPAEPECGIERWHVKILTDPAATNINWNPVQTSIAAQNAYPEISISEDTSRMPFEEQAVSISATIVAFKKEDDHDIHLVLVDAEQDSMIGEIPGTNCPEVAASTYVSQYNAAAQWVMTHLGTPTSDFKHVDVAATITGVLFQDFAHGQTGHARNYREIHPVTKIE